MLIAACYIAVCITCQPVSVTDLWGLKSMLFPLAHCAILKITVVYHLATAVVTVTNENNTVMKKMASPGHLEPFNLIHWLSCVVPNSDM